MYTGYKSFRVEMRSARMLLIEPSSDYVFVSPHKFLYITLEHPHVHKDGNLQALPIYPVGKEVIIFYRTSMMPKVFLTDDLSTTNFSLKIFTQNIV